MGQLEGLGPPDLANREPVNMVPVAVSMHHATLDRPQIDRVLEQACPYLDHTLPPDLEARIHLRVEFLAWMILKGYEVLPGMFQ